MRELRPLTRAVVAQQVGVHESTVSRATANKYVMLPTRKVIPFSDFFTPSLSIKDVIREMILKERAKGRPLTDREICSRLLQRASASPAAPSPSTAPNWGFCPRRCGELGRKFEVRRGEA